MFGKGHSKQITGRAYPEKGFRMIRLRSKTLSWHPCQRRVESRGGLRSREMVVRSKACTNLEKRTHATHVKLSGIMKLALPKQGIVGDLV